jgi:hypothetical protein
VSAHDEMTISQYGRGTCPVCGRSIRTLKDGTIGYHYHGNGVTSSTDPWYGQRCQGWGQKPEAAS